MKTKEQKNSSTLSKDSISDLNIEIKKNGQSENNQNMVERNKHSQRGYLVVRSVLIFIGIIIICYCIGIFNLSSSVIIALLGSATQIICSFLKFGAK
jgi:hypothetical protein